MAGTRRERRGAGPFQTIDAHVGGGVVRLIVSGVPAVDGETLAARQASLARRHDGIRTTLLSEPRGRDDMVAAMLTEPVTPGAHAGVLFARAGGWTPFSGEGAIGVATIAIERQLLTVAGAPPFRLVLDTVAGPVLADVDASGAEAGQGVRVARVGYTGPAASVVAGGLAIQAAGRSTRCDIVDCAGRLAIIDSEAVGAVLATDALPDLGRLGRQIIGTLDRVVPRAPGAPAAHGVEAVVFIAPSDSERADLRSVTVHRNGGVARSPSGRATVALMAVLDAMGLLPEDRPMVHEGLLGFRLEGRLVRRDDDAGLARVTASVNGSAWIIGEHTAVQQPDDPLRDWTGN